MFIISKTFTFEAAHRLLGHPKCGRLHGHSYRVTFELKSEALDRGMVRDYADLAPIKERIDNTLDHRYLVSDELIGSDDVYWRAAPHEDVSVVNVTRTTAEHLAKWFYNEWKDMYPELAAVTVCETAATTATYRFERGLR
jgi:6-pyruvoyltetrahydropterin/6-carboxytetrahydropterin synthase